MNLGSFISLRVEKLEVKSKTLNTQSYVTFKALHCKLISMYLKFMSNKSNNLYHTTLSSDNHIMSKSICHFKLIESIYRSIGFSKGVGFECVF